MSHGSMRLLCGMALALLVTGWMGLGTRTLASGGDEGRQLYMDTCSKCHGTITEDKTSLHYQSFLRYVVMTPLGPNLTGIYGRPAGIVEGYRYSEAFREMANGLVWDGETLDLWLADSQAMIQGSYMFLKMEQPARDKIISYLRKYSRYED